MILKISITLLIGALIAWGIDSRNEPRPAREAQPAAPSTVSTAKLTSLAQPERDPVLGAKLRKQTPSNSPRVQDEVADMIEAEGEQSAAAYFTERYQGPRERQRAAIEAVSASWAQRDAVGASLWLLQNTGENGPAEGVIEADLWESAVSGYIEGIALTDAETAVDLAMLLTPQSGLPVANPNNLSAPDAGRNTIEKILTKVETSKETDAAGEVIGDVGAAAERTDDFSPEVRDSRFPGDPGFPGDPDFLSPRRRAPGGKPEGNSDSDSDWMTE